MAQFFRALRRRFGIAAPRVAVTTHVAWYWRWFGYIALGALNRKEALIEFSLVRLETPLLDARRATRMRVELSGFPRPAPSAQTQQCKIANRDQQICDIALCAAFRCYVSRFFDAVGAGPDAAFIDTDAEFRTAMSVGKAA